MGKKRKRPAAPEEAPEDPDGTLEGIVVEGELYLRDEKGVVYASERDDRGALVPVGRWDAAAAAIVRDAPASEEPAAAAGAPSVPSIPHPTPEPLSFAAAEEDHCETAPEAYRHVTDLLRLVARKLGVPPEELRIYDPYFCNGAVARHLAALGFPNVYNRNEDFYAVQAAGQLPQFDVLLTNPPYTHPHPQRLLEFCVACKKPWLALMPNWVCTKDYYYASLGQPPPSQLPPPDAEGSGAFYLAPRKRYHYWTPKGRRADISSGGAKAKTHGHTNAALGSRTSPFVSFWYCGGFKPKTRKKMRPPEGCVLCWSVEALPHGVRDR